MRLQSLPPAPRRWPQSGERFRSAAAQHGGSPGCFVSCASGSDIRVNY